MFLKFLKKYGFYLFLAILFGFQMFFLLCDPDSLIDINTRGAWTDEALYSLQIRQFIEMGQLDVELGDTFVRSPIFNFIHIPFFLLLGTHLWVSRLIVLLMVFASVLIYSFKKETKTFAWALAIIFLTQYQIFQFSHYALVYMMCVSFLLMALYFFIQAMTKENHRKQLFFSALFIFFTYGSTVQFAPVILILPAASLLYVILSFFKEKKAKWSVFLWSIIWTISFALIYFLAWYLPNKNFIDYLLHAQVGSRFPTTFLDIKGIVSFNFKTLLWISSLKFYIVLGALSSLGYLSYYFIRKKNAISLAAISFLVVWLAMELPKVAMFYLPYRYLLSLISVVAVIIAVVFTLFSENKKSAIILFSVLGIVGATNLFFNYQVLQRRTNDIQAVNRYLNKTVKEGSVILGAWAPAFTWDTEAYCVPVWNGYLNDSNTVEKYNPDIIISEINQQDNDYYYQSIGFDLNANSDSVRIFNVWIFEIGVYWIRDDWKYQNEIQRQMQIIKEDEKLYDLIKIAAAKDSISIDSSLFINAK
jgi:4-amino-4-deoxy-L-arabinose transferase-like glycosyltransferase